MICNQVVRDSELRASGAQFPKEIHVFITLTVPVFLGKATNLIIKRGRQHCAEMKPGAFWPTL